MSDTQTPNPYRDPGERDMYDIKIDRKVDWSELSWNVFCFSFWACLGIFAAAVVCYIPYKLVTADTKGDYCFVESGTASGYSNDEYVLLRHVAWSQNRLLARNLKTTEDVRKEAQAYGCEIR